MLIPRFRGPVQLAGRTVESAMRVMGCSESEGVNPWAEPAGEACEIVVNVTDTRLRPSRHVSR